MFFLDTKAERSGGRLASEVVGSTIAKLGLHWCCQIHLDRSLRRDAKLRLVGICAIEMETKQAKGRTVGISGDGMIV